MSKALSVADAKRRFSDVLGAIRHRQERFVVERRGTPVAAIVPIADLEALEGRARKGVLALVGSFDDVPRLANILDEIVRDRVRQRPGRRPKLGR